MRACIVTYRTDSVMRRVVDALERYAPDSVELVEDRLDAELIVLHIIGRRDRATRNAMRLLENKQRYAVIQYALRSTQKKHTSAWLPLWRGASVVWSYYDLEAWCAQDWTPFDFPFYHAPLGVDSEVFWPRRRERKFIIGTCGHQAVIEGIREAAFATKRVGGTMLHLGPELRRGPDIVCKQNIVAISDDEMLACLLSECQYVGGLRRTEGFELMAAEGLLCGARPIFFDRAHYRQWHEPWGVFIPEGTRGEVIGYLEALFRSPPLPVTDAERKAAAELFDWKRIVGGFWERCLE
jgi:hypothetical protein